MKNNYALLLEKNLKKINPSYLDKYDKIIHYYRSLIELEQLKEPEIKVYYGYRDIEWTDERFSIDLHDNLEFYKEYLQNLEPNVKFPKDLMFFIRGCYEKRSINLLTYILTYEDFKELDIKRQKVQCKFSDFSLNLIGINEFELNEEEILKFEADFSSCKSLNSISLVVKNFLPGVELDFHTVHLALTSKNPVLSQLYSELGKINSNVIRRNNLLTSFLDPHSFNNEQLTISEEEIIYLNNLDESQRKAVFNSFNNKLSVITGPPGSGKTQVILNILANAVIHNKKVLVASKINKAVDNVKDRFDDFDKFGFFLRFGSRKLLENNTIPAINCIINRKRSLSSNDLAVQSLKNAISFDKDILKRNRALIDRRNQLNNEIVILSERIVDCQDKLNFIINNNMQFEKLCNKVDVNWLQQEISFFRVKRNMVEVYVSGFKRIFFNIFKKRTFALSLLVEIEQFPTDLKDFLFKQTNKERVSDFKNSYDIVTTISVILNLFKEIVNFFNIKNSINFELQNLFKLKLSFEIEVSDITSIEGKLLDEINSATSNMQENGNKLFYELIESKIANLELPVVNNYLNYIPNNIPYRDAEVLNFIQETASFLDIFNINCVTSLSAKAAFPLTNELFDIVVIDEASQCDIASAIPLIYRAKQLVVIGDPLQLRHISTIKDNEDAVVKEYFSITSLKYLNYSHKSLWDYCKELLSLQTGSFNYPIMINYHYRCHPDIIGYSNEAFYKKELNTPLNICTSDEQFPIDPKGIIWKDVVGVQKNDFVNINEKEAEVAIDLATLLADKHMHASIGIITPFRDQAQKLNEMIPNKYRDRIIADTVYKFQGDEKDIIIYSLVVTDNSPSKKLFWIDISSPNLVNVAVTRARNTLYIIGNKEYIRSNSNLTRPLGKLLKYCEIDNSLSSH